MAGVRRADSGNSCARSYTREDVVKFRTAKHPARYHRTGPHMIYTAPLDLDEAVDIIRHDQIEAKRRLNREKNADKPQSLRQIFSQAKLSGYSKKYTGKITLSGGWKSRNSLQEYRLKRKAEAPPHPFQSLSEEEKARQALQLYQGGAFGIGNVAGRTLAANFGVDLLVMSRWLGFSIETHERYAARHRHLRLREVVESKREKARRFAIKTLVYRHRLFVSKYNAARRENKKRRRR